MFFEENEFYSYYTVKPGDNLYEIGKKFNVNSKLISELNGIKYNEYIYPDQILLIPKKGVQYYITKENDTLKVVSNILGAKENEVINQNKTIYLLPGQMIFYKD